MSDGFQSPGENACLQDDQCPQLAGALLDAIDEGLRAVNSQSRDPCAIKNDSTNFWLYRPDREFGYWGRSVLGSGSG